jgi:hypothetical protein
MDAKQLALVQGMDDTRRALARWNREPWPVLGPWLALSFAIALALLAAVLTVAELSRPDSTLFAIPGYNVPARLGDYLHVLLRNSLVLALHAMACVAGFIAGSSLPLQAAHHTGISRWVHEKAGPLAIAFVVGATLFSLATQAYVIGGNASTMATQLGVAPPVLLLGLAPHALPELVAVFLPLAAWIVASRAGRWQDLLAATAVTVAIAVPVLLVAAAIEIWVSPHVLAALT